MNVVLIVLTFSLIIIIHELGHFLLAKANGIGVTEFSLGMGPRIISFVRKETRYSLKLFPIGGSCMMVGEDNMGENVNAENAFNMKSVKARISVIIAGPLFNFILAFILAVIVIGYAGIDRATISSVVEDSGAEYAGIQAGDIITEINGNSIAVSRELQFYLYTHTLDQTPVEITLLREGKKVKTQVIPTASVRYVMGCNFEAGTNKIEELLAGYPLADSGAKVGDTVTKIDGTSISDGAALNKYFEEHPFTGSQVSIELQRGNETISVIMEPKPVTYYKMGISYYTNDRVPASDFFELMKYSFNEVIYNIRTTVKSIGMLVTGNISMNELSGPVGVVDMMNDIYEENIDYGMSMVLLNFLNFSILISANLGVMNLLPIPALDGGRLVFLFIEGLRGKPISREKEGIVHLVGFAALMLLMVFVLFNDITRLFS